MLSPVFLIGSPRSGKTLLSATLNKHPEILIFPELNTFSNVFRLWNKGYCRKQTSTASYLAQLLFKGWEGINKQHSISIGEILDRISPTHVDFGSSLDQYMRLLMCKAKPTAKIWGDDTPHNTGYIRYILEQYPNARFIYSQRDPRNVVSDLTVADYRHASNHELQNAFIMKRYVSQYIKQRQLIPQSQLLEIRHEAFLENPQEATERMCKFLNIDYLPALIEPADQEIIQIVGWPNGRFWQKIQPEKQAQVSCEVEAFLAELIAELGYTRNGLCRLNYSKISAQLKLLPYLATFMTYNIYWKFKYSPYPFLVSRLPYLQ